MIWSSCSLSRLRSDIPMISVYHNTRVLEYPWPEEKRNNDRMTACYVMKLQPKMRSPFHGGCPWWCRCLESGTWLVRRMVQPIHRSQPLNSVSVTATHRTCCGFRVTPAAMFLRSPDPDSSTLRYEVLADIKLELEQCHNNPAAARRAALAAALPAATPHRSGDN